LTDYSAYIYTKQSYTLHTFTEDNYNAVHVERVRRGSVITVHAQRV
jgi:hypothetical protein